MASSEFKPLATLRGGRTKKVFKLFWHTKTHCIYVEQPGFFGSSKVKTGAMGSSWEMSYHAAEAYVHEK